MSHITASGVLGGGGCEEWDPEGGCMSLAIHNSVQLGRLGGNWGRQSWEDGGQVNSSLLGQFFDLVVVTVHLRAEQTSANIVLTAMFGWNVLTCAGKGVNVCHLLIPKQGHLEVKQNPPKGLCLE